MGKGSQRNIKPCTGCGVPRKFKDCCEGLSPSQVNAKRTRFFFNRARNEANIKTCLHPSKGECSPNIIRAHSIQNNRILDKLSVGGESYMADSIGDSGESFRLIRVGRNSMTTFTGFCGKHDNQVFAPIEEFDYTPGNSNQEMLFAYRAFCKERHAKMVVNDIHKIMDVEFADNPFFMTIGQSHAEGIKMGLSDQARYAKYFDDALLSGTNFLETTCLTFEGECDFSATSMFSPYSDFEGNEMKNMTADPNIEPDQLFLTVFPQNGKTHCIISYRIESSEAFSFLKKQLFDKPIDVQKELLSRLVVCHIENAVYSPRLIEGPLARHKDELETVLFDTVHSSGMIVLNKKLNFSLFQ